MMTYTEMVYMSGWPFIDDYRRDVIEQART